MSRSFLLVVVLVISNLIHAEFVFAENSAERFKTRITKMFEEHHLAKMVDADVAASEAEILVKSAAYFPTLSANASIGKQDIDRDSGTTGAYDPMNASVTLNQLIYDFGITSSRVELAKTQLNKEYIEKQLQRANLLMAAIEAQLGVIKAQKVLSFTRQSESNVREQTKQESARVEAGRGYATDVLQAKAQLSGAEARSVSARSNMNKAIYRFKAIFNDHNLTTEPLEMLMVPNNKMPETLAEVEALVLLENPDIKAANARVTITLAERNAIKRSEYSPRVDLELSQKHFKEMDGIDGNRKDNTATLNFKWNFNLGMKGSHLVNSANNIAVSTREKANYVIVQALEDARNAWNMWTASRESTGYLTNQVNISKEFLRLARKERELGRRSLLDILSAEISLTRAESDAAEAEIEKTLAAYKLLRAVGQLRLELFDELGMVVSQ
ncbi:MAG: TolC family protein [Thiotrichaceae bacterium]|nr:TolC family protein [Thiotrichaceae bacterium]